jgi:hypothetical protein
LETKKGAERWLEVTGKGKIDDLGFLFAGLSNYSVPWHFDLSPFLNPNI